MLIFHEHEMTIFEYLIRNSYSDKWHNVMLPTLLYVPLQISSCWGTSRRLVNYLEKCHSSTLPARTISKSFILYTHVNSRQWLPMSFGHQPSVRLVLQHLRLGSRYWRAKFMTACMSWSQSVRDDVLFLNTYQSPTIRVRRSPSTCALRY